MNCAEPSKKKKRLDPKKRREQLNCDNIPAHYYCMSSCAYRRFCKVGLEITTITTVKKRCENDI